MPPGDAPAVARSSPLTTVALIPARYASTRFPGKALADLDGRTMIEHVYRRTAACTTLDAVIVATDDSRIADAVRGFGGDVRLTRPEHPSGLDRLAEVAETIECEIVVNVQGDEPLVTAGMIEGAIAPFERDPALEMSTLRTPLTHDADREDPHVVKVVVDAEGYALYFSRAPIPYRRNAADDGTATYKHVGLYAYRRPFLLRLAQWPPTPLERTERLEQLRALEHGSRILTIETAADPIGVDTPQDLERVRQHILAEAEA